MSQAVFQSAQRCRDSNGFIESAKTPTRLFDYDVIGHIGTGAGSHIYMGRLGPNGPKVALKHILATGDPSGRFLEQLRNEYEVGRQVRDPGLRRVIELKVHRSLLCRVVESVLIMELIEGQPLDFGFPASLPAMLDAFRQAAHSLNALHRSGFIHCDFKPGNLLIGPGGHASVIDLGQACPNGKVKPRIQGTPDFISPEQVKCQAACPQTDVYSLGATMYYALTGVKMPTLYTLAKGENSFLVDSQLATPAALNPRIPECVSGFVMECVHTNVKKRPATMACVAQRLECLASAASRAA